MGEVRLNIAMTNASDEALFRRGIIKKDDIHTCNVSALIDTGEVRSVIPVNIVEKLSLKIRGQRVAEYADGRKDMVGITEPIIIEIQDRDTIEEAMVLGDEVLIGQTVLEKLDLFVDCVNNKLIPNPAHPDQPVSKVKLLSNEY